MHFDLKDVEVVVGVARQAGELVRRMQEAGLRNVHSKTSAGDLVTEADVASERLIRAALARHYPAIGLWGEESNTMPDTEYFWLVDPIDGTTNFAFGLDYNAVNIALQHRDRTLLGVTHQIHTGRVYYSLAGEGAVRREAHGVETRLKVNDIAELRRALVASGFPYHSGESIDNNTAEFAACHDVERQRALPGRRRAGPGACRKWRPLGLLGRLAQCLGCGARRALRARGRRACQRL